MTTKYTIRYKDLRGLFTIEANCSEKNLDKTLVGIKRTRNELNKF